MHRSVKKILASATALLLLAAIAVAGFFLLKGSGLTRPAPASGDIAACKAEKIVDAKLILCMSKASDRELSKYQSPSQAIAIIQKKVDRMDKIAQPACHGAMHLSGAKYAKEKKITLANMINYLPAASSTNCAAGFTHGVISVLGVTPKNADYTLHKVCSKQKTRAEQFACVHGIGHGLRHTLGDPKKALKFCDKLKGYVAEECAQGIYHDFFMALPGTENPTQPLGNKVTLDQIAPPLDQSWKRTQSNQVDRFCLDQPKRFLYQCWVRLLGGPGVPIKITQVADMQYGCAGLQTVQYLSCIAGMTSSRIDYRQVVKVCGRLAKSTQLESRACLSSLDLKAVGGAPPGSKNKAPVSPRQYRKELIPQMLADCSRYMPNPKLERYCIINVSKFSLRVIPGRASLRSIQEPCRRAKPHMRRLCLEEMREGWKQTATIKL